MSAFPKSCPLRNRAVGDEMRAFGMNRIGWSCGQRGKTGDRRGTTEQNVTRERHNMKASKKTSAIVAIIGAMSTGAYGQVSFDGFEWLPLGQAQLSVTAGGLQVDNIGSSGNDGVSLQFPNGTPANSWGIDVGLTTPNSPANSFVRETGVGTINGVPNQVVDSFTATAAPSGGTVYTCDFSPMAPSSLTVNYYSGGPQGTLVLSESGVSPGASAWGPGAFDATGILSYPDHGPIRPDGGSDDIVQGIPDTFGGGSALTADSFDIIPVGSANTFGGYSADNFTAGGISSFTITGVSVIEIPEPATFSLVALGGLAVARLRLWRSSAQDRIEALGSKNNQTYRK